MLGVVRAGHLEDNRMEGMLVCSISASLLLLCMLHCRFSPWKWDGCLKGVLRSMGEETHGGIGTHTLLETLLHPPASVHCSRWRSQLSVKNSLTLSHPCLPAWAPRSLLGMSLQLRMHWKCSLRVSWVFWFFTVGCFSS